MGEGQGELTSFESSVRLEKCIWCAGVEVVIVFHVLIFKLGEKLL